MLARATTHVSILSRTTTHDQYGDEHDSDVVEAAHVPASLIEKTRWFMDASSNTPMTVRTYTARVPSGTDVKAGDRIEDEHTGYIYVIEEAYQPSNPLVRLDITLTLRRKD